MVANTKSLVCIPIRVPPGRSWIIYRLDADEPDLRPGGADVQRGTLTRDPAGSIEHVAASQSLRQKASYALPLQHVLYP